MSTNKEIVLRWLTAMTSGDVKTAMGLFADDFRYYLSGSTQAAGWTDVQGFLNIARALSGVLAGPLTMRFGDVTAEDDRVLLEAESEAPLTSGGTYANTYVMAFKLRDGKIAQLKEFTDTLHLFEVIDVPEIRGPRKPRESPIEAVTLTVSGPAVGQDGG